jgi:hypothetical protein
MLFATSHALNCEVMISGNAAEELYYLKGANFCPDDGRSRIIWNVIIFLKF